MSRLLRLQVGGEFHALSFASAERWWPTGRGANIRARLLPARLSLSPIFGMPEKKCRASFTVMFEDVVDVLALVADVEDLGLVAGAFALLAGEFDVGEELHLDGDGAIALAGFATSAGNVEGEMSGGEAVLLRFGQRGEEFADVRRRP